MNAALIRLEKKIVIDAVTSATENTHEGLKNLWHYSKTEIDSSWQQFGRRYSWTEIGGHLKKQLTQIVDEYGQAIVRFLGHRLPPMAGLSDVERSLLIEDSHTEIAGFTTEPTSLVLHYFLRTEQLTLIDTMGDRLLLAKGNVLKSLKEGNEITNTFMLAVNNDYSISNYTRIKP